MVQYGDASVRVGARRRDVGGRLDDDCEVEGSEGVDVSNLRGDSTGWSAAAGELQDTGTVGRQRVPGVQTA